MGNSSGLISFSTIMIKVMFILLLLLLPFAVVLLDAAAAAAAAAAMDIRSLRFMGTLIAVTVTDPGKVVFPGFVIITLNVTDTSLF
jgi:hypothetical protein